MPPRRHRSRRAHCGLGALVGALIAIHLTGNPCPADERTSLGPSGCRLIDLAAAPVDGTLFAGCDGPQGLFVSRDFGSSWRFATGGSYDGGRAKSVAVVGSFGFAVHGNGLFSNGILRTPIAPSSEWSPVWSTVVPEDLRNPTAFVQASPNGTLLAAFRGLAGLSGDRAPFVRVYDPTTMAQLGESTFPDPLLRIVVSLAADTTRVYAIVTEDTFGAIPRFFRASIDPATGELSQWSNRTNVIGLGPNERLTNVAVLPDGRVVVVADRAYISANAGGTFAPWGELSGVPSGLADLCSTGTTVIFGENRSLDGGMTWTHPLPGIPASGRPAAPFPCAIPPSNPARALVKSPLGVIRTTNVAAVTPTWEAALTGLNGVDVSFGAMSRGAPRYGVLVTAAGLAVSATLDEPTPQWRYPLCPTASPCSGATGRATVTFDPADPAAFFYVSADHTLYRGVIGVDSLGRAEVTWSTFSPRPPDEDGGDPSIRVFPQLPDTLVVTSRRAVQSPFTVIDGSLRFYRRSNGALLRTVLENTPVQDVAAVTPQLLFATVRHDLAGGPFINDPQGLYKSTDGGVSWLPAPFPVEALGERPSILELRYSHATDTLYARGTKNSAPSGFLFTLPRASTGSDAWRLVERTALPELEAPPSTALQVDPSDGIVYAALGRQIYGSATGGSTWQLLFTGLPGETITLLDFAIAPGTDTFRLLTGGNAGVQRFVRTIAPTPPPPTPICRLSASKQCTATRNTRCTLSGTFGLTDGTPILSPVYLESSPRKGAKKWRLVRRGIPTAVGTVGRFSRAVKRPKESLYARMRVPALPCTTRPVRIRPRP